MAIDCSTDALTEAAACYNSCIPKGMQDAVVIYILNELLARGYTPNQLMQNASTFQVIPPGMAPYVIAYLLCQLVNAQE